MGIWCFKSQPVKQQQPLEKKPQIQKVDEVKFKLKKARDTIKNFINAKNKDIGELDAKIAEKVPAFKQTGNKKELIPLLQAKKSLQKIVQSGQTRLKVVSNKLDQVEMQQINIETINVLDDSNKYIQQIQSQLEKKDWRNVLDQAKNKYELEWPDDKEQVENDPAFQEMWKELGGDAAVKKVVQKKKVKLDIQHQKQQVHAKRQQALA